MTAATLPRFAHGALVTATHPITRHSVTGTWNANIARLVFDLNGRRYTIPLEQLDGCTFTEATP